MKLVALEALCKKGLPKQLSAYLLFNSCNPQAIVSRLMRPHLKL